MTTAETMETPRPLERPAEENELRWMMYTVGISSLDGLGWIRATGEDRTRWLNGMVTNSIQDLQAGEGNYSFALNAQGRIQGDLWAFADDDAIWIETAKDRVPAMMALFDRFIIMDDVELEDVSAERAGVGLVGPMSAELLGRVGLPVVERVSRTKAEWKGCAVEVIATGSMQIPRFEIWADETTAVALREDLVAAAAVIGGVIGSGVVGAQSQEWLRVMMQTPSYGIDIRDKELPQETGQTRALHFAKGCYLGQEIVERIRSRGNVHRQFGAFALDGPLPAVGAVLEADGKVVGELTSVAAVPMEDGGVRQLALGYVRREVVERGAEIRYISGESAGTARPVAAPSESAAPRTLRDASDEMD